MYPLQSGGGDQINYLMLQYFFSRDFSSTDSKYLLNIDNYVCMYPFQFAGGDQLHGVDGGAAGLHQRRHAHEAAPHFAGKPSCFSFQERIVCKTVMDGALSRLASKHCIKGISVLPYPSLAYSPSDCEVRY